MAIIKFWNKQDVNFLSDKIIFGALLILNTNNTDFKDKFNWKIERIIIKAKNDVLGLVDTSSILT